MNFTYLQLLSLTSVHAFIQETVDVAIYETYHGGEYDASNVFPRPAAIEINTIGLNHVIQSWSNYRNIAWHKAGIFHRGTSAFAKFQAPVAAAVLEWRAAEKETTLEFIGVYP